MFKKSNNNDAVKGGGLRAARITASYLYIFCMPNYIYNMSKLNVNTIKQNFGYSLAYKRLYKNYSRFFLTNRSYFYNSNTNVRDFSTSLATCYSRTREKDNSVYKDIYKGRGVPNPEPFWVKSNEHSVGMFGASWNTPTKLFVGLPIADPKVYHHIPDPYHNKNKIYELCKGMMVVYIWTYKPKAFCLVGSSSNSVERINNYFRPKSLLKEGRRAMEFFSNYGFKDVDLYIIPLNSKYYTINDMKSIEAYYIRELYTPLNVQREVYISPLQNSNPSIPNSNLKSLSKSAVPVYVFKEKLI